MNTINQTLPKCYHNFTASRSVFKRRDNSTQSDNEDYTIIDTISLGKNWIFLASHPYYKKPVVVKMFPYPGLDIISDRYLNESRFKKLSHPSLIQYISSNDKYLFDAKDNIYVSTLVMEQAPYGDLAQFISKRKHSFDNLVTRTYFHQLIEGLSYLHSNGIYHLDLKLQNLLIGENYQLKIIDLDGAITKDDQTVSPMRGTKNFRAPELLVGNLANLAAADVYSAAIVLFAMKTRGYIPFQEKSIVEINGVLRLLQEYPDDFWKKQAQILHVRESYFEESFRNLFMSMINPDPELRITLDEIKNHDWYNQPILSNEELIEKMNSCSIEGQQKSASI